MSARKNPTPAPAATVPTATPAGLLVGGNTVAINGKTIDLIPFADLPRRARRELRNALFKAAPDNSSTNNKMDLYLAAYEVGLIALHASGAHIDPNDDTLDPETADELDQIITLVGFRMLGDMNAGASDPKNAAQGQNEAVALTD